MAPERSLRTRRVEAGLTQRELAELVGCDVRTIGRIETGERKRTRPELRSRIEAVLVARALPLRQPHSPT